MGLVEKMQDKITRSVQLDSLESRRLMAATKIMPLGDSITEGWPDAQSYRYDLYNMLAQAGYSVDMVGSQTGNYNKNSILNNLDQNHEGHSGWTADQIAASINGWANTYKPDVVLLQIGTNDVIHGQDNPSTISDITSIVSNLRAAVPSVKIVLAQITPETSANGSWIPDLNSRIATLATSLSTAQSPIKLVDQYTGIDTTADLTDGIHPNISGELKLATKWYTALQSILPTPTAPPTGTYLDGLTPTSATNGSGSFEQDRSNGGSGAIDGGKLTLNGAVYMRGLGVSASSALVYDVTGKSYTQFNADIGVDDEITSGGGIKFQVYADNVLKYDSGTMTATTATKSISVNITGASAIKLVVADAGGGSAAVDHGDWANARFYAVPVTIPTAPSGLTATAGSSGIALKWTDNSTNELNFRVERKAAGGSYATLQDLPANTITYTDTTATPGTAYTYRVFAYNTGGNSGYSNEATATVAVVTGNTYLSDLPYVVNANGWGNPEKDKSNGEQGDHDGATLTLNGTTYAKGLGVHATSDITLSLAGKYNSFTTAMGVDDEVGSDGSVVFQIYVDGTKQYDSGTMTGSTATKTTTVSLANAQTLRLVVTDAGNGNDSDHGDWANAYLTAGTTTVTVPNAPSNAAVSLNAAYTTATVSWSDNSSNETGFVVQRKTGSTGTWATIYTTVANAVSYADSTITRGQTYYYRVAATNSAGTSATSNEPSVAVPALNPPAAPTNLSGVNSTSGMPSVNLNWIDNATNETAYRVERKTGGGSYVPVLSTGANLISYTDGNITAGTTYTYRVIASNADGDSAPSNEFTITTTAAVTAPAGASNVTASYDATSGKVTLGWTDNSTNETGFRIERRTVLGGTATIVGTAAANAITFPDVGPFSASTTYYYRVIAFNSAGDGPSLAEPSITTPAASSTTAYLSDLAYVVNDNGWGAAEKDRSNGEQGDHDGGTITLNGKTYTKGIGVHAHSDITYNLAGKYTAFTADIGVDDEVGSDGSVVFQVFLDGVKAYDSGTMTGSTATKSINVNTTGKQTLELVVTDAGNGNDSDHGDWANAQLIGTTTTVTVPAAASGVTGTFASGTSLMTLNWIDNSTTETGFRIERKADSGSYAPVGTTGANVVTFTDPTALASGHTYTYRVFAYNNAGDAAASNEFAYTVAATVTVPTAPSGLTATYNATSKTVSLAWTDNSSNETAFRIEKQTAGGAWTPLTTIGANTKIGTDGGPFAASTTYSYRVIATNSAGDSTASNVASFTSPSGGTTSVFVSDLTPTTTVNGWGPYEKDHSNGEDAAGDGGTISIRGKTYAKGLGVHGYSVLAYNLGGAYTTFTSDIGVDDETGGAGTVIFDVYVDGVVKYTSGVVTGKDAIKTASVNVAGAQQIWLVVENSNDGADSDHADWANATLTA